YDGVLLEAARARANRGLGMSKCPVCGSLIHVVTEQFKFVVVEGGSCRVLDKAPVLRPIAPLASAGGTFLCAHCMPSRPRHAAGPAGALSRPMRRAPGLRSERPSFTARRIRAHPRTEDQRGAKVCSQQH